MQVADVAAGESAPIPVIKQEEQQHTVEGGQPPHELVVQPTTENKPVLAVPAPSPLPPPTPTAPPAVVAPEPAAPPPPPAIPAVAALSVPPPPVPPDIDDNVLKRPAPVSKAREVRLEQNRKAARESRRRKKVMIEELQRSVIFFSRANSTLKQQNDELSRILMRCQAQVAQMENGDKTPAPAAPGTPQPVEQTPAPATVTVVQVQNPGQQAQAQAVATQAIYESQGFPPAAARAAAQTINAGAPAPATVPVSAPAPPPVGHGTPLPALTPGSTMQAMANFQQAATAAMQAAMVNPAVAVQASTPSVPAHPYGDALHVITAQHAQYAMTMQPAAAVPFAVPVAPGTAWIPAPGAQVPGQQLQAAPVPGAPVAQPAPAMQQHPAAVAAVPAAPHPGNLALPPAPLAAPTPAAPQAAG